MATNFVQPGECISVTAPTAVSSGDGVLVGSIFGVANVDADSGAAVEISLTGVWTLSKDAAAINEGDLVYWDGAQVSADNPSNDTLIGVCVADASASDDTCQVRLNGSFR